jgi:ATP-binding cassette subfamily B protein
LNNICFEIGEGKVTAIVGASGSGKTTLLKLLLKFYEPTSGQILVGATQLSNINQKEWRTNCGVVMQDGYIFSDTIANNITLGLEPDDQFRLSEAARIANILEFIDSLPLGFNTLIGSEGSGISQGQRQRILIARAVYKDPKFIYFDEATNSLDANNEREIMKNLDSFFKGRTVVVVAHRLSTVRNADQIIVLDSGEIVEKGTHEQLIKKLGKYYELVKNQLELGL